MTAYTALMAQLPRKHYSLRIDSTHLLCSASVMFHGDYGLVVVCSATAETADLALERLLERWQGREQVAA